MSHAISGICGCGLKSISVVQTKLMMHIRMMNLWARFKGIESAYLDVYVLFMLFSFLFSFSF